MTQSKFNQSSQALKAIFIYHLPPRLIMDQPKVSPGIRWARVRILLKRQGVVIAEVDPRRYRETAPRSQLSSACLGINRPEPSSHSHVANVQFWNKQLLGTLSHLLFIDSKQIFLFIISRHASNFQAPHAFSCKSDYWILRLDCYNCSARYSENYVKWTTFDI